MFPLFHYSHDWYQGFIFANLLFLISNCFVIIGNQLSQTVLNADLVCADTPAWYFKKKYQENRVVFLLDENGEYS